ncbi:hypothetical protein FB45DRAFT_1036397 [Roridomyces roridus]|uniref:Uncharacterized protein n=1 Tax=Roridomyces roridus TaxID=1738132 RepID=A0AAD7FDD6_9AGAR|nr:hypothetical protein FB45DRAFT_1036397 [Roridomyces roridus]
MPRPVGRPPLEPAEKERRRKKSKAEYEDRNHDLRRRKARERMQRKRASLAKNPITHFKAKRKAAQHSEGYRDRKLAETQAATREEKAKQATTNRQRKEEVYEMHLPARRQREAASAPRTTPCIAGLSLSAIHAAESDDEDLLTTNFPAEPCSPVTDIFTRPAHPMRCAHCFSEECIGGLINAATSLCFSTPHPSLALPLPFPCPSLALPSPLPMSSILSTNVDKVVCACDFAVAVGRHVGIFTSAATANEQTDGHPGQQQRSDASLSGILLKWENLCRGYHHPHCPVPDCPPGFTGPTAFPIGPPIVAPMPAPFAPTIAPMPAVPPPIFPTLPTPIFPSLSITVPPAAASAASPSPAPSLVSSVSTDYVTTSDEDEEFEQVWSQMDAEPPAYARIMWAVRGIEGTLFISEQEAKDAAQAENLIPPSLMGSCHHKALIGFSEL